MAARIPALATSLLFSAVLPLSSQTLVRQTHFEQVRDSLSRISDTGALRLALKQVRDSHPLRAGLIGLRLGELGADPDFSQAISSFRRAARREPRRPEPWYGLGLAEAGRSREEMQDPLLLGNRVGLGALERGADSHVRALAADPRFVSAALVLADLELSLLDTVRLKRARTVLRRAVGATPQSPPSLLLAWGRVERAAGTLTAATHAFERYLAAGGSRAIGLLELARTQLALGLPHGDTAYYEGASLDDPEATAGYRADLELIAPDSSLREFDRLTGGHRAAFLHRFWTDRDHYDLRPEGERLREHYRRLVFARRHFPLTISRRFYGRLDAYRSGNVELDDRGIIYIRQGEPADRLRPFIFGAMPNESWRYARADGDLLFHFSAGYDANGGGDLYDYRLVQSVLDLRGAADAPRDQLILSRQSLSPMYSRMLNWGAFGSANERARERNIGAASITLGTTTDSHELQFRRRLSAVADLIAVGQHPKGSLAHLVFGIAAPGMVWHRTSDGVEYPVKVRLVALDRHNRAVATLDTSIAVRNAQPLTRREYVVGRVELPLPPGRWEYRAALEQGDSAGVLLTRRSVLVGHNRPYSLSLSGLALGSPARAVQWVTDAGDTVLLAPAGLFRERSEIQIYYEVSGASRGSRYRHEISVRPSRLRPISPRAPLVTVAFDEVARGSVIRSQRTVRLDRLKRGTYLVEVKVTGPDGRPQVRQRAIQLIAEN
jgi:GWxTD domain-containing protein